MNKLTAVFLDVLGEEIGQEKRTAELAKKAMQTEFSLRTKELLSPGTFYCSGPGNEIRQDLAMLMKLISGLNKALQAVGIGAKLAELYVRAEQLHRDTQKQIHKYGHIDARRLHFFYKDEQQEALGILESYIRAELFRILVTGGGEAFLSRKPLKGFQHTLQDRMKYLREEIFPMTDTRKFRLLSKERYWAVQHTEEKKAGPLGVLPGFTMTDPVKTDHRFMAGEHDRFSNRRGIIWQGIGYLTNVTPQTVTDAQKSGALNTSVTPEQLTPYLDHLQEPDAVLGHLFSGSFYVIDPVQYFGAASCAEASAAIRRRSQLGQCLLCGKASGRAHFCESCARRIRIV